MTTSDSSDLSRDLHALDQYLAGEATPEEAARWRALLEASPDALAEHAALLQALGPEGEEPTRATLAYSFARLRQQIESHTPPEPLAHPKARRETLPRHISGNPSITPSLSRTTRAFIMTAGVAILAIIMTLVHTFTRPDSSQRAQHFATAPGQRSTIQLANGSTMILAPATTVTMTADGATVAGEAYFTMTPNPRHPFVVRTRNTVATVLGTSFAVRQYPDESASRVVVEDGKVAVHVISNATRDIAPTVLTARMLAHVTDSTITTTSGVSVLDATRWRLGVLVFDRVILRDVVAELRRAYDVDIRVTDTTLAAQPVYLELPVADTPIARILELIGEATDSHVVQDGRAYLLAPGRLPKQTDGQRRNFPQAERLYGR